MSVREHDAMVHTDRDGEVILISVLVHGEPIPQGSKRWMPKSGTLISANDKKLRPWRDKLAEEFRKLDLETLLGPVQVELAFYVQHLASHFGSGRNAGTLKSSAPVYAKTRPDIDKLTRAVLDAMTESALIRDDGQVAVLIAEKRYARTPGVHVKLRPL